MNNLEAGKADCVVELPNSFVKRFLWLEWIASCKNMACVKADGNTFLERFDFVDAMKHGSDFFKRITKAGALAGCGFDENTTAKFLWFCAMIL